MLNNESALFQSSYFFALYFLRDCVVAFNINKLRGL